nr:metalloproteinase 7 [Coccidioides posadasii]
MVAALAALATPAFSCALPHLDLPEDNSGLDIKLDSLSNTRVKATITNKADRPLNLLKFNTFFDDGPTEKVGIFKDGNPIKFDGIMRRIQTFDLPISAFVPISPGESIEREFDIASTSDLTVGGAFDILSEGAIPYAEANQTTLTGAMVFKSNALQLKIDGEMAATVARAIQPLDRRSDVHVCRNSAKRKALMKALRNSAHLAGTAASAAYRNPRKVQEYFHTTDRTAVRSVAARLKAISRESGSTRNGATRYACEDHWNRCEPGVLAYTLPSHNLVVNCPSFYNLPALTNRCHGQDQATTVLHEFAHAPGVHEPFCKDHAYGYRSIRRLSTRLALNNADSFSLFANGRFRRRFRVIST